MADIKKIWKTKREIFCLGKINETIDCGWGSTVGVDINEYTDVTYDNNQLFGYCKSCSKPSIKPNK